MCMIELVDYNENLLKDKEVKKEKAGTRRGRRKADKKETETVQVVEAPSQIAEEAANEEEQEDAGKE